MRKKMNVLGYRRLEVLYVCGNDTTQLSLIAAAENQWKRLKVRHKEAIGRSRM